MNDKLKSLRDTAEYAEEKLVASVQILLHEILEERGMSKTDLANKMGVTKARVSQIFSDDQNFTFRLVAKAFHALGEELYLGRESKRIEYKSADACGLSFAETTQEISHGFEWLDRQIEIGGQPIAGASLPKNELANLLREAMEAALANAGEGKLGSHGDRDHGQSAARNWANSGNGANVIQFARKRTASSNV